jgi:hypothetical protein
MARETVVTVVSDISGKSVPEGQGARIEITYDDAKKNKYVLDVTAAEANDLAKKGTEVKRRGRRPGTKVKASGNGRRTRKR